MSTDEISTWLEQGLEAAASGDRAFAREQLRRVVEADEHNLQAWLALNEVAATLEDREECLQNILKIDPNYAGARQQLSEVQARLAAVDVAEVEEDLSPLAIAEAVSHPIGPRLDFSADQLTDPLLCVYCGHLTREEDRTCPHCHRRLYEAFYENEKPRWIALGWIVSVGDVLYNLVVMGAVLFFISIALASIHVGDRVDVGQLLLFYSGQPNTLSPQVQTLVLNVLPRDFFYFRLGYIILITIVAFGLLTRRRVFHLAFIACLAATVASTVMTYQFSNTIITAGNSALATPFERILRVVIFEASNVFTVIIGAVAVLIVLVRLALIFLMEDDFAKSTERLWNKLEIGIENAHTAFVKAKSHMRNERWTLAAGYLQQAITFDGGTLDYFIALAEAYAHMERYTRALAMLDQAQQLQINNPTVLQLRGGILALYSKKVGSTVSDPYGEENPTA